MAKTELHKYTATEKINRMDVDLIDIEATLTADGTDATLMFDTTEIPFAVAGPGGASIIHSVVAVFADDADDTTSDAVNLTDGFRIVFTSDSTSIGSLADVISADTSTRAILDGICGYTDVVTIIDHGLLAVGSTSNVGIIGKAIEGSTSLYCYGITQSDNDYNSGKITLRIGVIKN
jgi:hypothetical protein